MQSHATAENFYLEAADGVKYAYRRFGNAKGAPPLVLLQHFRGNLENLSAFLA